MIVGPTAVGKTGVSILLARELDSEIISADSMQIYRGMDIGTEKPTPLQLSAAPHHMIDIAEPSEEFSAGKYLDTVRPIIEGLHAKGKIPIMAGGTGLYVMALTRGIFDGPDADWPLRAKLMEGPPEANYLRLKELDPETAAVISPLNIRRVVRALEICIKSGEKASTLRAEKTKSLPYEYIKIGLFREREELYPMIETRVDEMMERGLVDEVRGLQSKNPSRTALQAIGYKEIIAHLNGEYDLKEAVRLIKRNTRRYAKRQYTWFKKEEALNWVDVTGCATVEDVYEKVQVSLKEARIL